LKLKINASSAKQQQNDAKIGLRGSHDPEVSEQTKAAHGLEMVSRKPSA
jgi:hypothetical protein